MITYDFRDDGQIGINPGYTLMAAVQNRWQTPVHLPTQNFSGCGIRPWGLLCTRDRRRRQFSGLHLLVHGFLSTMSCSNVSWMNQVTVYKNHWPFTKFSDFFIRNISNSKWMIVYCTEGKLIVWCTCQIFGRIQSLFIVFIWQCDTHAGVIGCYERFKLINFLFKIGTKLILRCTSLVAPNTWAIWTTKIITHVKFSRKEWYRGEDCILNSNNKMSAKLPNVSPLITIFGWP